MCLLIDFHQHNKIFGKFRPRIAFRNILVHKYLKCLNEHIVYTPIQYTKCLFKDGICELREDQMLQSVNINKNLIRTIEKGIHSSVREYDYLIGTTHFYAIIPRFSFYWVGCSGDIVSNRLIIFTNSRWSIWKVHHKFKDFTF